MSFWRAELLKVVARVKAVEDATWAVITHAATGKTTPVDADEFSIVDSAASNVIKKLTWANLKEALRVFFYGANKVTPIDGDVFGMLDSATSFSPKYSTWAQIKATMIAALGTAAVKNTGTTTGTVPLNDAGTFTPTINGTTTAGAGTYSLQGGTFRKIGDLVWVKGILIWSAHTGTGNMIVAGLPFTSLNDGLGGAPVVLYVSNLTFAATLIEGFVAPNSTTITLQTVATGAAAAALPIDTAATLAFSAVYTV